MHQTKSYDYVLIGIILRAFANLTEDSSIEFLKKGLKEIENLFEKLEFHVSSQILESVSYGSMKSMANEAEEGISVELASLVRKEFSSLEKVVFAEASTKKIYTIPSRRFNSEYLLNSPEKLFQSDVFHILPDIARSDIASSCKCILFGEATASAFHILRATEDVLKTFYFKHRKQKRLKKPMWGPMVEQLRAKKTNKPDPTLLDSLDVLRKNYRNPTQHPNAIYTIDTAQDLFGVCLDVIGKMGLDL